MTDLKDYKRWVIKEEDLRDLSPIKIRNLILNCLFEAQKEAFLHNAQDEEDREVDLNIIKESMESILHAGFKEIGGNFDDPTQEHLEQLIQYLADKSKSWGTPREIVDYHFFQMKKIIDSFKA
jgi:hypothetical protein